MRTVLVGLIVGALLMITGAAVPQFAGDDWPDGSSRLIYIAGDDWPDGG